MWPKKTEIKTCLQSKGYTPSPESVQNSNADQRQLEYPIPPPESVQNSNTDQRQSEYPIPSPESVQNSNTDQRQSEYPSFAFWTDGARGPCVLALPLGPK